MDDIKCKEYLLSDLSNLVIVYDIGETQTPLINKIVLSINKEENQYCLSMFLPEYNGPIDLPLSYGSLKKVGKLIYLKDTLSDAQIILKKKGPDSFYCCSGFYFLTGKDFIFKGNSPVEHYCAIGYEDGIPIRAKRERLYENEKSDAYNNLKVYHPNN